MKKLNIITIFVLAFSFAQLSYAQVLSESAKRKVTVGVDLFSDIVMFEKDIAFMPPDFSYRTINQGANVFIMYNFQLGTSLHSFSAGLGIRNHNWYSRDSKVDDIKFDSIIYSTIEESFKRTKLNFTYLDLPVELKLRTESGFKIGIGLKVGYNIHSKQKYVGNRPKDEEGKTVEVNVKQIKVNQVEDWTYGATFRIGYKWISVFGYYQFNSMFVKGKGPQMNPLSLGITITPF